MSDERATMLLAPLVMLAAVAVGLLVGLVFAVNSLRVTEPWCPTEDSCVATYQSGGWHITEVTP